MAGRGAIWLGCGLALACSPHERPSANGEQASSAGAAQVGVDREARDGEQAGAGGADPAGAANISQRTVALVSVGADGRVERLQAGSSGCEVGPDCGGNTPPRLGALRLELDGALVEPSAFGASAGTAQLVLAFEDDQCNLACGSLSLTFEAPEASGATQGSLPADLPCQTTSSGVYLALPLPVDPDLSAGEHVYRARLTDACGAASEPAVLTLDSAETPAVVPPITAADCAALTAMRTTAAAQCTATAAFCAGLAERPGRVLRWIVTLREHATGQDGEERRLDDDELETQWECIADYARGIGLQPERDAADPERLRVDATPAEVEPLLARAAIVSYEPECLSGECAQCTDLSADACAKDAACALITARHFDVEGDCMRDRVAGCMTSSACADVVSAARGPDGKCWIFGGCVPPGFTASADSQCAQHVLTPPCDEP